MVDTHCRLLEGTLEHDAMYTVFGGVMGTVDPNGLRDRNEMLDTRRAIHRVAYHPEARPEPTVSSEAAFLRAYSTTAEMLREELRGYRVRIGTAPPSLAQLMERDVLRLARAQAAEQFCEHAGIWLFEEFTSGNTPRHTSVEQVQRAYWYGGWFASPEDRRALGSAIAGNRWYTTTVESLAGRFGVDVHVPASVADVQRRWRP